MHSRTSPTYIFSLRSSPGFRRGIIQPKVQHQAELVALFPEEGNSLVCIHMTLCDEKYLDAM